MSTEEKTRAKPNLYNLQGKDFSAIYSTSSISGKPQLSVERKGKVENYQGDEIRRLDTEMRSSLITVNLEAQPDLYTLTLTLAIPPMNLDGTEAPFKTFGVLTTNRTSIGGPNLVEGQIASYEIVSLTGQAKSVTDIPDSLKVPPGNVLLLRAYGKGVQIYTCPDTTHATPHAVLLERDRDEGDLVAIHFAGPSWQATKDGSIVVGDAANAIHVVAPDPYDIDWLLLPAKSTTGNGLFSKVTFIQRLHTDGGKIPPGSCDQKQDGTQILDAYCAQYLFYVPRSEPGER